MLIIFGGVIEDDTETNEIWLFDLEKKEFNEFKFEDSLKSCYLIFLQIFKHLKY